MAFDRHGQKLWSGSGGEYGIADCYALNFGSSEEVYFYYYDDFHLIHLSKMKEMSRHIVEGDETLEQFMFYEESVIGQLDLETRMRFKIRNRTIVPKEKLMQVDENGKRILGPVFMRGRFLYAYGKDGIYRKESEV